MANTDDINAARAKRALLSKGFRYYNPSESPAAQGFYYGFPCHLGHRIRDSEHHWCYHCALKIKANICGLDINFIHGDYQNTLVRVMNNVDFQDRENPHLGCWRMKKGFKAPSYPSWRSGSTGRMCDRVQAKKIIYQAFWGDVGKLYVTTASNICGDEKCVNPLHTTSSFNCSAHRRPNSFQYLDLDWNAKKHMIMALRHNNQQSIDDLLKQLYKPTISDPKIKEYTQSRQDIDDESEHVSTGEITSKSP